MGNELTKKIQITPSRAIGNSELPFIIAEIGNNHNGDMELARKLIIEASEAGVDSVKFQTKNIERAFPQELLDSSYLRPNSFGKTYREHKQALELSERQLADLKELADSLGLIFFSTPFDIDSVELLERVGQPLYKIASFHVNNLALIDRVCQTGKPLIMSTGMSSLEEIDAAVDGIRKHTDDFVLLQCTSSYPSNYEDLNLAVIPELASRYDCLVGYSGHERGISVAPGTILLGACVIERHFTLDRTMKGPDHAASLERRGLELLVSRSRSFYTALGSSTKRVLDSEMDNRMKNRGY